MPAFGNEFEVPFWGTYFVATKGRFFADLMVRQEFYNINLNNPAFRVQQPAGRGARLVDLGVDGLQFRSGPGLVHRAVGRLHLFQDLG